MEKGNKYLIIMGIVLCIVIACLSPFLASADPDGLEKSAEDSALSEDAAVSVVESPFPDYTLGDSKLGEIVALIIGIVITITLGFGVAYIVKKHD
ncbi:PDGLE domain-containing protein [Methanobrevibacter curvatus]|uniref:Cobalt transport protein CbiN n=1 Tax=Methanobrevibacter curvatus TaxID=49547 RepID=A0A166CQ36_9EURY|nr:PDGLE domain-containing protein [Methanobrevibacter curvatus]KZX15967.1 cobalt transport protein CbiN [Methanobrevibacter curvatus]